MPLGNRRTLLINRVEQFTKTDLRYLFSGGSWLAIGQVVISVISFLTSLAFAHYLSKETYGTYRFLISLFWTLTAIGLTGIPTALVRAIAKGDGGAYWTALRLSFKGSIPFAVAAFGFAIYYALHGNTVLAVGALIIALIGPGMQASYLYGAMLEGKQAFKANALSGIVLNLIPLLGLLVLMVTAPESTASTYLGVYLVLSVGTAVVLSYIALKLFPLNKKSVDTKELESLGIHLSVMNILFTLSQQADKLLVFHALGAAELAIYSFAVAIPDQLRNLFGSLETLSMPRFTKRPVKEVVGTLGLRLSGLTLVVTAVVFAYIFAAPYIFRLLLPSYVHAIFFSQIYALSLIPIGSVIPVSLLQAHGAKRELYIYNTAVPLFQIGTAVAGVYVFGIIGVIASRIATRLISLLISLVLLRNFAKANA